METLHSIAHYLKDHILFNPIAWGIFGVIAWIMGSAFIKAWRGKDEDQDGQI